MAQLSAGRHMKFLVEHCVLNEKLTSEYYSLLLQLHVLGFQLLSLHIIVIHFKHSH